jgi:hypothetical protein
LEIRYYLPSRKSAKKQRRLKTALTKEAQPLLKKKILKQVVLPATKTKMN